jgi:Polyketide synthase modules and related proteins
MEESPEIMFAMYSRENPQINRQKYVPKQGRQQKCLSMNDHTTTPVAIIGISGIFPQSESVNDFWNHLVSGHDLVTEIPPDRRHLYEPYSHMIKWGGFIPDVDQFDAQFFGISPKEAELMDPQQRLCLQTVWKTFEDAGYRLSDVSGSQTGRFYGMQGVEYAEILKEQSANIEALMSTGTDSNNDSQSYFIFTEPSWPQ